VGQVATVRIGHREFRPEVAQQPAPQSHAIFANALVGAMRLRLLLLPVALVVVAALGCLGNAGLRISRVSEPLA
jgi:hypothetical protein